MLGCADAIHGAKKDKGDLGGASAAQIIRNATKCT